MNSIGASPTFALRGRSGTQGPKNPYRLSKDLHHRSGVPASRRSGPARRVRGYARGRLRGQGELERVEDEAGFCFRLRVAGKNQPASITAEGVSPGACVISRFFRVT